MIRRKSRPSPQPTTHAGQPDLAGVKIAPKGKTIKSVISLEATTTPPTRRYTSKTRSKFAFCPTPPESSSSPASSDCEADDEDAMSMEDIRPSPPTSVSADELQTSKHSKSSSSQRLHRPTLPDVLSNTAPPPWTLSAFTAFLSQNHCLENLEFTLDAERYRVRYENVMTKRVANPQSIPPLITPCAAAAAATAAFTEADQSLQLCMLWRRLIAAYIMPDGQREINIPSDVRANLLAVCDASGSPPDPEHLAEAVRIIYNLMQESVLVSFLNSFPPSSVAFQASTSLSSSSVSSPGNAISAGKSARGASSSTSPSSPRRRRGDSDSSGGIGMGIDFNGAKFVPQETDRDRRRIGHAKSQRRKSPDDIETGTSLSSLSSSAALHNQARHSSNSSTQSSSGPSLYVRERSSRNTSRTGSMDIGASGSAIVFRNTPEHEAPIDASTASSTDVNMTPPNSPPLSDVSATGSSPRLRGDNTWRKMLGWKNRQSRSNRASPSPDDV